MSSTTNLVPTSAVSVPYVFNHPFTLSMAPFYRWSMAWDRTWAYRLFHCHHTELNALYWSHVPALRFVYAATRPRKREEPAKLLLTLPGNDITRINISLGKWADNYSAFDNWVRLNALVSITGYLEVYLKTVTRLALESDPGMLVGTTRGIDGLRPLKNKPSYSFADEVIGCVRGTWHERIAHYRRLFGHVPALLETSVGALERLRTTRNGVSHAFGRATDDYDSLRETTPKPIKTVSEDYLKKTLALVDKLAIAVDKHLGPKHIGEYEALYFYHHWDRRFNAGHETEAQALAARIGNLQGRSVALGYYEALIAYYRSI